MEELTELLKKLTKLADKYGELINLTLNQVQSQCELISQLRTLLVRSENRIKAESDSSMTRNLHYSPNLAHRKTKKDDDTGDK